MEQNILLYVWSVKYFLQGPELGYIFETIKKSVFVISAVFPLFWPMCRGKNLDRNSVSFWYFWCVLSVSFYCKYGPQTPNFYQRNFTLIFIWTSQEINHLISGHPVKKTHLNFQSQKKSSQKNLISVSEWFHSFTFFLPRFNEYLTILKFSGLQEKLQCMMEKHKSFQRKTRVVKYIRRGKVCTIF